MKEATDTYARLELRGKHQLGFQSVMHFRYSRMNGGLAVDLDQVASGMFKRINLERPFVADLPNVARMTETSTRNVVEAFRVISYRLPPIAPPGADSAFIQKVRAFLGVWRLKRDPGRPPEVIFIDGHNDRVKRLYWSGDDYDMQLMTQNGELMLKGPDGWALVVNGPRLCQAGGGDEWERDENFEKCLSLALTCRETQTVPSQTETLPNFGPPP
jgi:hypothetical protein